MGKLVFMLLVWTAGGHIEYIPGFNRERCEAAAVQINAVADNIHATCVQHGKEK